MNNDNQNSASKAIKAMATTFLMLGLLLVIIFIGLWATQSSLPGPVVLYFYYTIYAAVGFLLSAWLLFLWSKAVNVTEKTNQYLAILIDKTHETH